MQAYISERITCIENAYIAGTNRDWFHYVLLWSNRRLGCTAQHSQHSVRMMSARSAALCSSLPAVTVSQPLAMSTGLPSTINIYQCLHTRGGTAAPLRLHPVATPQLLLYAYIMSLCSRALLSPRCIAGHPEQRLCGVPGEDSVYSTCLQGSAQPRHSLAEQGKTETRTNSMKNIWNATSS